MISRYETNTARIELYNNRCYNIWDVINYKINYESTPTIDEKS